MAGKWTLVLAAVAIACFMVALLAERFRERSHRPITDPDLPADTGRTSKPQHVSAVSIDDAVHANRQPPDFWAKLRVEVRDDTGARVPQARITTLALPTADRAAEPARSITMLQPEHEDALFVLPMGSYLVVAAHGDYLDDRPFAVIKTSEAKVSLVLQAGRHAGGRFLMLDGSPVGGAMVTATVLATKASAGLRDLRRSCTAQTSPDGTFVLGPLDEAGYRTDVLAPGRIMVPPHVIHTLREGNEESDFRMAWLLGGRLELVDRVSGMILGASSTHQPSVRLIRNIRWTGPMQRGLPRNMVPVACWEFLSSRGAVAGMILDEYRLDADELLEGEAWLGNNRVRIDLTRIDLVQTVETARLVIDPE